MRAAVWNFTTKSTRGHWEEKRRRGWRGADGRSGSEDGEQSGERERDREREEKQNERDGDEDGERRRGRGTRETKGMWSSPSLCLAALWLKRRIPREGGGSRPAQSVLSLPWSPACRPQKRTAKNLQDGLLLLHRAPPPPPLAPKNLQSKHRLSRHTSPPLNFRRRGSTSDEPLPGFLKTSFFLSFFFDVLMKISRVS